MTIRKKTISTLLPTEEEKKKARVIRRSTSPATGTPANGETSVILDIPERTTDHLGRILEINKPRVRNPWDMPEILLKKCRLEVGEIGAASAEPSTLPCYANKSHISASTILKKKIRFKD